MQRTRSGQQDAIRSGILTGLATAAVSGSAAVAGALLSRHFGHGARTDGFFAAYAVYLVLVLVASSLRVVLLPQFARTHIAGVMQGEVGAWGLAIATLLAPLLALALIEPRWIAAVIASGVTGQHSAMTLVPWLVAAAAAQVFAGACASALAALGDYLTAAFAFSAGAIVGVAVIGLYIDDGVAAFGWGIAANGGISLGIPLIVLIARRGIGRPRGRVAARLRLLAEGAALPCALQGLYLIGYRFAGGLGVGKPTTFAYAYLIASLLVAVTATSIALVSSVPLAREALTPERAARHIVAASWVSLSVVAGAAGFFAIAGGRVTRVALGAKYGGATGAELGHLVAYLAPWTVTSVALSVAFPLLFIRGAVRWLPLLAVAALGAQALVEWAARSLLGLSGIAAGMAVTTGAVLVVLLAVLGGLAAGVRGLLVAAAYCGGGALVCYGIPRIVVAPVPAAFIGIALYVALVALWRPAGLRESWSYLRALA